MISVNDMLKEGNYKSKMLLQVHDELVFDIHKSELENLKILIKERMEAALSISVPLEVEVGMGENWLEAH